MFYFKIDGDAANFDLNISLPDGTETFNGEITFGGCITYNDKNPNLSLISDSSNNSGYETFIQLKDDKKTVYAQTAGKNVMLNAKIDGGKITADFTKKGNNSVLLTVTQDENETFNDIVNIEGSLTLDTTKRKISVNKDTKITAAAGYSIKNSVLTFDKNFSDSKLDLTNYEIEVTKIDAYKLTKDIEVIANTSANSIKGGKGNDIFSGAEGNDTILGGQGNDEIFGGAGNDTLTGGTGNDVFIFEGGNDFITDYTVGKDKISLNPSEITSSTVKGSNVILTTENGTLTIKSAKNKAITFSDKDGNTSDLIFYADVSYKKLETGLAYDTKRTFLTASSKFPNYAINLEDYLPTVTKVKAGAVKSSIIINGNDLNNSIKSGAGDDILMGGNGNDTLTGGAGADMFIYESGDDVITDYTAGQDTIIASEEIKNVEYKGQNVIFTVDSGTLTVRNAKDKEIIVSNGKDDGEKIYSRAFEILYDNNFMTDEIGINEISEVADKNYSVGKIEDSTDNEKICSVNTIVSNYSSDKNFS